MPDFKTSIVLFTPKKSLSQRFLINSEIARREASFAKGKRAIEIGPGYGILTNELAKVAKSVIAVELDHTLFLFLKSSIANKNVTLINKDFLKTSANELELETAEIIVANVPYSISSKVIAFVAEHRLEAVLCMQKEFVERMLARAGTSEYSRLSAMSQLSFSMEKVMEVGRRNFSPVPKVDSCVIHLSSKGTTIDPKEKEIIGELMIHKRKTVRSAILCSSTYFKMKKEELRQLAENLVEKDTRVFQMNPQELVQLARKISTWSSRDPAPARV